MARKTTKSALTAIHIHDAQCKAIYEHPTLSVAMKELVLGQLNIALETLLHRENCYHGFKYVRQTKEWKAAIEAREWEKARTFLEDSYHHYFWSGVEGDRHLQQSLEF